MQVEVRRVVLDRFPSPSTIELHPIIFAILHFSSVLERLREEVSQKIVIGRVFESQVANVTEIFVELLCKAG